MGRRTIPALLLLLLCSYSGAGIASIRTDVRCYCNLPACSRTGHMCRSRVCVSQPLLPRYACIEMVAEDFCDGNVTRHCCREDMCNYPRNDTTSTHHVTGYLSNHDTSLLRGGGNHAPSGSWFRFAVGAVPVVGGVVLVVLIVVAARMLKSGRGGGSVTPINFRKHSLPSHWLESGKATPLAKSLSCVVLGCSGRPVVRSCASMVSLGHAQSGRNLSPALSTETDTSREQYFVFDL